MHVRIGRKILHSVRQESLNNHSRLLHFNVCTSEIKFQKSREATEDTIFKDKTLLNKQMLATNRIQAQISSPILLSGTPIT